MLHPKTISFKNAEVFAIDFLFIYLKDKVIMDTWCMFMIGVGGREGNISAFHSVFTEREITPLCCKSSCDLGCGLVS